MEEKMEELEFDTILHSLLDKVGGEPRRNPEVADLIQRIAHLIDTKEFENNS
jgi:hypothetical protein